MSGLVKFECPVCNQNMECERACSGNVIHCPGCGAEIRIPFYNSAELLGISRAELVTLPPATASHDAAQPATGPQAEKHEPHQATVNCPACHADLKVVIPDKGAASTTLLHKPPPPPPKRKESPPAETAHPDLAHMSLEEREKQIAQAREAHPVQANPTMKPRLDYVLEGKAPPPMENPADQKAGERPDDSTTLTE